MTQKEIVTSWFASIDEKNFDTIRTLMDPNHQFYNPMTPGPLGVEHHIGMMDQMTAAFEGEHLLDIMLQEGSHVVVKGRWSGKHIGEFNGIPATGKLIEFSWMDLFEIKDGKVANEYFEMNPMSIMSQISEVETETQNV